MPATELPAVRVGENSQVWDEGAFVRARELANRATPAVAGKSHPDKLAQIAELTAWLEAHQDGSAAGR